MHNNMQNSLKMPSSNIFIKENQCTTNEYQSTAQVTSTIATEFKNKQTN